MAGDSTDTTMAADTGDIVETGHRRRRLHCSASKRRPRWPRGRTAGRSPLTVFAPPTRRSRRRLESLGLTKEELLADTETLSAILLYNVVEGAVPAADVVELDGQSVTTLNGADVAVSVVDGKVFLNEDTEVVATDVMASNGVIHVIDAVLLPPA
jgi:uncharacterized surface protein with fasciclin (FAS1) repeats